MGLPPAMEKYDQLNAWMARSLLHNMNDDEVINFTKIKFKEIFGKKPAQGELVRLLNKMWANDMMTQIGHAHLHQPGARIHGYRPNFLMPGADKRSWYQKLTNTQADKHPLIGEYRKVKGLSYVENLQLNMMSDELKTQMNLVRTDDIVEYINKSGLRRWLLDNGDYMGEVFKFLPQDAKDAMQVWI